MGGNSTEDQESRIRSAWQERQKRCISIRKDRVSKLANHKLKKLLYMAAMACIRAHVELKAYYLRKVKEGKNKMLVINAMRNKLAHRIFAVIKRQTPYINPIGDTAIIAGS